MKEIKVGLATCGIAAGGETVYEEFKKELKENNLDIPVNETGCMGMCYAEVLVELVDDNESHLYSKITPDKVKRIITEHVMENTPVEDWIIRNNTIDKEQDFSRKQKQIVLRNCGVIDPGSIDDYIARDGYNAIQKCLKE